MYYNDNKRMGVVTTPFQYTYNIRYATHWLSDNYFPHGHCEILLRIGSSLTSYTFSISV